MEESHANKNGHRTYRSRNQSTGCGEQVVARGKGVTTGAAVTAIAAVLGNEVAASVMRNPSLTIDEMLEMVCQSVREMAHIAANPSPEAPNGDADLSEQEFAQLTMRIIYTATTTHPLQTR